MIELIRNMVWKELDAYPMPEQDRFILANAIARRIEPIMNAGCPVDLPDQSHQEECS